MKTYGFHQLGIEAIQYDEQDIAERQKTQRVIELAASRKAIAINPITVASGKLVAGRDRLAADLLNGERAVWCHVVTECSATDLLRMEVEENVRRRDVTDRNQQIANLAKAIEAEITSKAPGNSKPKRPGRPVTPKGEARAAVAKVAGVTPEAVRRAETRAAAKAERVSEHLSMQAFLKDFGVGVDQTLDAEAERVAGHLQTASKALARAQAAFTEATAALEQLYGADGQAHYTFTKPFLADAARLRDQAHALAGQVRAKVPTSLCEYGKGTCTKNCGHCLGLKWSTAGQASAAIPAELKREGAAAMVSNGAGGFNILSEVAHHHLLDDRQSPPTEPAPSAARREPRAKKGAAAISAGGGAGIPASHPQPGRQTPPPPTSHTEGMGPADVAPIRPKKGPPRMQVELADGRVVDPTNPPEDMRYSGDDAPAEDLPELEVDRDEAIEWADDDGEAA